MGVAERSERLVVVLVAAGLTGLGVPFVLAIGLWLVAAGSTITFGQRVLVVRKAVGPGAAPRAAAGAPARPPPGPPRGARAGRQRRPRCGPRDGGSRPWRWQRAEG